MIPSSAVGSEAMDTSQSSMEDPCEHDSTFHLEDITLPTSGSDVSLEASTSEQSRDWSERKWIVNESSLMERFRTCHTCGVFLDDKKTTMYGSMIKMDWTCTNGHNGSWQSCPYVNGKPENNLVSSAAILFTGTTQNEIGEWAELVNLQLPKKTAYYSSQSTELIPVVHDAYTVMQEEILTELKEKTAAGGHIDIGGDARWVLKL